jgi:hypothetical protein
MFNQGAKMSWLPNIFRTHRRVGEDDDYSVRRRDNHPTSTHSGAGAEAVDSSVRKTDRMRLQIPEDTHHSQGSHPKGLLQTAMEARIRAEQEHKTHPFSKFFSSKRHSVVVHPSSPTSVTVEVSHVSRTASDSFVPIERNRWRTLLNLIALIAIIAGIVLTILGALWISLPFLGGGVALLACGVFGQVIVHAPNSWSVWD